MPDSNRQSIRQTLSDLPHHYWFALGWITASIFVVIPLSVVMKPFRTVMDVGSILGIAGMVLLVAPWMVSAYLARAAAATSRLESPVPVTDAELLDLIDPATAVVRTMNATERQAFNAVHLVGAYAGKTVADWIADPANTAPFLKITGQWWTGSGEHLHYLVESQELPTELVKRMVNCSMYVTFALRDLYGPRRSHLELAAGACLWARGYADALGWKPAS